MQEGSKLRVGGTVEFGESTFVDAQDRATSPAAATSAATALATTTPTVAAAIED